MTTMDLVAMPDASPTENAGCVEPLAQLARFSYDWAPTLCDPEHGCCDYHRGWSSVRLLEQDGALPAGEAFFTTQLRQIAGQGKLRVLLSGAADTGLAALVLRALRPVGCEPEIVMIDRCRTTVEQNRLFAQHQGFSIELHQGDAVTFVGSAPVDAIVAHSFLGFIPPDLRPTLIQSWSRMLRPGGRLLMSHRFGADDSVLAPPKPEDLARRKLALQGIARAKGWSEPANAELCEVAAGLWQRVTQTPRMTLDDFRRVARAAHLDVLVVDGTPKGASVSPLASDRRVGHLARVEVVGVKVGGGG